MLKPRVLLFVLGVLASIFGNSDSYSYAFPGSSYMNPYFSPSYGYGSPSYGSGGYGGGGYGGGGYDSSYSGSASCENAKVIEVLDQIFCQHGAHKRYSSTVYPIIDVVIDQVEYLLDYCFLQTVLDYLSAAQQTLQTLQDAVYTNYEYSTLLAPYFEGDFTSQTDGTSSSTSGTSGTASSGSRVMAQQKLTNAQEKLKVLEKNAKTFKTSRNLKLEKNKKTSHSAKESHSQRAKEEQVDVLNVDILSETVNKATRNVQRDEAVLKTLRKRMAKLKRETKGRKTRDADYSDYTCALLYPINCDYDKYDDLLYNILERLWTAFDFLDNAAFETWLFIEEISCDTDDDRWALIEASITYGAIVTSAYTILDLAFDITEMYELIELEYGSEGRAAGGSGSGMMMAPAPQPQPQPMRGMVAVQVPMMQRPMSMPMSVPTTVAVPMTTVNRTPATQAYPFSQYVTQPQPAQTPVAYSTSSYQTYSYPPQQQPQQQPSYYRVSRGSAQPSVSGSSTSSAHHVPAVLVVG